jgi:hypothetical protein
MKRFLFIFIAFILAATQVEGQATRVIKKRFSKSKQHAEVYEVLRSNKNIKHGNYQRYFKLQGDEYQKFRCGRLHQDNFLKTSGQYHMGKRHGEWVEYSSPGKIRSIGKYESGKKSGIWCTIKENGKVMERIDFDTGIRLEPELNLPFIFDRNQINEYFQGDIQIVMTLDQACNISDFEVVNDIEEESIVYELGKMMKEKERLLKQYQKSCTPGEKNMIIHFGLE